MNILIIGAGGVGASMLEILSTRGFFKTCHIADIDLSRATLAVDNMADPRFKAHRVDAFNSAEVSMLLKNTSAEYMVNACDPRVNEFLFKAAFDADCNYLDMAMNLSIPHPQSPYSKVGVHLGQDQFAEHESWKSKGLLALVGMGVEPGLSNIFAKYAAQSLFDTISEIGVRDGSNLSIEGYPFAPTFSIWTTIEECLNPPIVWERDKGLYTTTCFSSPEIFHFPAGIGPQECVNVEHEEVLMIPRSVECDKVTFKYALSREFIDWLQTFADLGLDSKVPIKVGDALVAPRDVLAAVLPNPSKLGNLMHGRTCAGTWVKGVKDGQERQVYLYHVADNATTMREWHTQAVLWQTALCPVVALEMLITKKWEDVGVYGPDHFDALPYLNALGDYGTHHGIVEISNTLWPPPVLTGASGWSKSAMLRTQ